MSIEQKVNNYLNRIPVVKKVIKRCYQLGMYAISPKLKSEGDIIRVSPDNKMEYFFGYYDKSPWDTTGRFMLCLRARNTWSDVAPHEPADILLIDVDSKSSHEGFQLVDGAWIKKIASTNAWNVQQSCMLQWLGPNFNSEIIYNDFRDGKYCSVIMNVWTGEERILPMPVYTVSDDGKTAMTLDFSRLHRLRKGYGYSNLPDSTASHKIPDSTCIWKIDLNTGDVSEVLKYTDFYGFEQRKEMIGAEHKVNHIMLSPSGKRFMVFHRWFNGQRKYTRLLTCNVDGSDMYNLSDDDMASHCYWKNEDEIIAFENKKNGGPGYYLMKDKSQEYQHLWAQFSNDGHPSYSPDRSLVVTDMYPDRARIAGVKVLKDTDIEAKEVRVIARVFAPFKYDNDTRCDLHPRWRRDGKAICFDGIFEGHRGLYIVNI